MILIDNYRGFDIYFDKETEQFKAISGEFDTQKNKHSLTLVKKSIDDFIKENLEFKPVWVHKLATMFTKSEEILLTGIRKDGRFVYENEKGEYCQLSNYHLSNFFIKNPYNDKIIENIGKLREQIKLIEKEISVLDNEIIKEDLGLKNLKEKYIK